MLNLQVNENIRGAGLGTLTASNDANGNTILNVVFGSDQYQIIATSANNSKPYTNSRGEQKTVYLAGLVPLGTETSVATVVYSEYNTPKGQGVKFSITPKSLDLKNELGVEHLIGFLATGTSKCEFYEDKPDDQANGQAGNAPF